MHIYPTIIRYSCLVTALLIVVFFGAFGQTIEYTLTVPGDTTKHYYIAVFPEGKIKGSIILLPGFGELPSETLVDCDIHMYASKAGFITIIPALGDRSFFYIDDYSHDILNNFVDEAFQKYNLASMPFFMGGFSFGGTMAMQYTQRANESNSKLKKPAAVFAIDPPLDIERLFKTMTNTNRPGKKPVSIQENIYVSETIVKTFGQNPVDNPDFFWTKSPYANSDPEHRSLKSMLRTPVRIYNEPDIQWYIENRNADYNHMNVTDSGAMINWLRYLGNQEAELITTTGKGYRIRRNLRHPHSWTIADGKELVEWMSEKILPGK